MKNWLIGKDPDAGKDRRQEEKGTIEDEIGWHHWLNGHEFEEPPRNGEGQGALACCSPWGCKDLYTTVLLNNNNRFWSLYSIEWSDNNTSHFSWRAWCLLEDCWLSGEICLELGLGCPSWRCRLQGHRLIELHLLTTRRTTKDVTAQGWMFGLPPFSCNILCCCEEVGNKWLEWFFSLT